MHALFASILTIFLKLLLFCCYFKKFVFKAKKYKPYKVVILSKFIIDDLFNISSLLEVCLAGSAAWLIG